MSDHLAGNEPTVLERWKALAEIENRRARRNWGAPLNSYVRPDTFGNPEENAARERRDAEIEAWADAGMDTREISARTGLVETTINRLLRIRRMAARVENGRSADKAGDTRETYTKF